MYNDVFSRDLQTAMIWYEHEIDFHTILHDRPDIIRAVIRLTFCDGQRGYLIVRRGYPQEDTIVIYPSKRRPEDMDGIYQSGERILLLICQMLNEIDNQTKGSSLS